MPDAISRIIEVHNEGFASAVRPVSDPLERMLKTNIRHVKSGQVIVMEADPVDSIICLLSGWLSLSKSLPEGAVQIVDFALPGEIIEPGAAQGAVASVTVEAVTDASVAIVPVSVWTAMTHQRRDLGRVFGDIQGASRSRVAERMLRLGRGNAGMRMAYALLELNLRLEAIGQASGGKFHMPMTQRVLGDFIGLSSVHVCRTLGRMTDEGILRTSGQMDIEILDFDALTEIAGVELDILQRGILAHLTSDAPALAVFG